MRRFLSLVFRSASLFVLGWPFQAGGQDAARSDSAFTIRADVPLVLLDVSVRDTSGGFVSGLNREAFTVQEDGVEQKITQFANTDVPVTVGIVVDNSGSMRSKKPEVITAALAFIQSSNPLDEMFVINFNDRVRRGLPDMVPFSDDIQKLRAALAQTDPVGRTALYDGMIAALQQLEMGRRDKKTLVLISDGGDNISTHTFREVMDQIEASRATIYTIGIFDPEDKDKNPDVLKKIAQVSGGVSYLPKKLDEVVPVCRQIAKDIRARYTIGYVPSNLDRPGKRKIRVAVSAEGHGRLIAHTRSSYVVHGAAENAERRR